jgi:hypothetical protein
VSSSGRCLAHLHGKGVNGSGPFAGFEKVLLVKRSFYERFERRLIGQRTREALEVKKSSGVRFGRPGAASVATSREEL